MIVWGRLQFTYCCCVFVLRHIYYFLIPDAQYRIEIKQNCVYTSADLVLAKYIPDYVGPWLNPCNVYMVTVRTMAALTRN